MQDTNLLEDQPIAWTPTPDVIDRAQLTKFMKQVGVSTWDELYEFSIRDVEKFTEEVLRFLDIKFDPPYEKLMDTSGGVEFPTWFQRNADAPVRNKAERNADAPVRNEAEGRTTAETFANKKGWHHRGYLPHFDGFSAQFVTFRLADSLPQSVLRRLQAEIEQGEAVDRSREYRLRVEEYLDQGVGECILRQRDIAEIVKESILLEDGKTCRVFAWVIMPNHVHILLQVMEGQSLSRVLKSIKGASSHKINKKLGRAGSVWQPDYFDRFIRDEEHFDKVFRYISNNPVKAGLCSVPEEWEFGSASPQAAIADEGVRVPTAGLNITTMCLDRWQTDEMKDQPAMILEKENGEIETLSYAELLWRVRLFAGGLRGYGVKKGDAVGIHLPMIAETVIALLAINRIGAIAVPVFSGYGVEAIASRMNAVGAGILVTAVGFERRGKRVDAMATALEAAAHCPSISRLIIVGAQDDIDSATPGKPSCIAWKSAERFGLIYEDLTDLEPTSAEDPLIILYTSGTTGKPKGIAHTHASFPIKAAQDMAFGTDVGKGTRISWYTDIGWMMGPWLIYGALINGATICIYDGAPDYPTPDRMWEFCAKHKVEVLGISPTLVRSLATHGDELPKKHDLSSLRAFASTGEPWNPAPWWWLFEKVGNSKLPIINYSGGTEIAGGILMGNPLLPIKPCSFPAPCPGMDVDIFDDDGNPVGPGKVGELVIKQPWIGMARGFWQEKERYLDTYWRRFKNIWVHGDFAMRDKDGHWFILGRSDDTLKVAGKRVGPAEVESLLVAHPLVTEAAVIGVPDEVKGTAMVAFVVTSDEGQVTSGNDSSLVTPHSSLETELKALVARDMGKPLAPSKVHFVSGLPKTRNAKVMRRVIRSAYLGEDPGDLSALEDPKAVEAIASAGKE